MARERGEGTVMVAALYVHDPSIYDEIGGVETWPESRDARAYGGPHPVVAHPPCARWGRLWKRGGPDSLGKDGGCFAAALGAVRAFGGVIEHPSGSNAWPHFRLPKPGLGSRWVRSLFDTGWSCSVDQVAYGHPARKRTWLYYIGATPPPDLDWRSPAARAIIGGNKHNTPESVAARGLVLLKDKRDTEATPRPFAELLVSLARGSA